MEDYLAERKAKVVTDSNLLFKSSINHPIMVSWPKAMKYLKEGDIIKKYYPETARKKYFGIKNFKEIFDEARQTKDKVVILGTRLDLM